jgi:BioD-like phosphotransacetylase family protein
MLDAKVLVILGFRPGIGAEMAQQLCSPFRDRPHSGIINLVPQYRQRQLAADLSSELESSGTKLLGAIPTDRTMASVTVQQIADHVNGQWVVGQEGAEMLVENLLIGGNIMDSGETYFGRHDNKAVLIRGDRPDIQLACLNTKTACLVLTGGFTPNQYVFHEAERRDVPLLVVDGGTVATADALDEALGTPLVHHPAKIQRFRELMRDNVNMECLMGML